MSDTHQCDMLNTAKIRLSIESSNQVVSPREGQKRLNLNPERRKSNVPYEGLWPSELNGYPCLCDPIGSLRLLQSYASMVAIHQVGVSLSDHVDRVNDAGVGVLCV